MFSGFANSWQLVKASWAVLQSDKELLWFPVISGFTILLITIIFFVPASALFGIFSGVPVDESTFNVIGFVLLFLFYLVSYSVSIYFNTALIGAAMIRFDGGDPKLSDGFEVANSKLSSIFGYALVSATVGMILRAIQERGGIIGSIVSWLGGVAWNLATFLVVPVLVVHDVGPIDAIKRSASLLKETWGEQITGNFSLGAIFMLIYLALFLVGGGLVFLIGMALESVLVLIVGFAIVVLLTIMLAIINGALNGIFQAALYRYAQEGVAPDNFDIELIRGAFKPKKKKAGLF